MSLALATCDPEWISFQGFCYKVFPYPTELNGGILESRWECLRSGADLATVKMEDEYEFVTTILGTVKVGKKHLLQTLSINGLLLLCI